jgi:predicted dehydrogenase
MSGPSADPTGRTNGGLADAVIVATQDAMHADPAVEFARQGRHLLVEKPMAPNEADCRRIVKAVKDAGVILAVGHVLRYTPYTQKVKSTIDSGSIGDVVSVEHLERVGYWHYAHSYVRGNWRNEAESSPMLLAKSCHDIDWLRYVVGARIERVASFGSLRHFTKDNAPEGAAERCLDCKVEETCPYSAKRFYLGRVEKGRTGWPVSVLVPDPTVDSITKALRAGPYGRCVYACDNDVVDHQVVIMEFEGGRSASFTMVGPTEAGGRRTRIFGTRGALTVDGTKVTRYDFLTEETEDVELPALEGASEGGHGGGDERLLDAFLDALNTGEESHILSGPDETLETHLAVFAAERARREGTVVEVPR